MPPKEKYTDPKLRDEVKEDIKQSDKGGEPGQWSARKAQMMAKEYKNRGGDYNTPKSSKDESQQSLSKWGDEEWQTKEGSGEAKKDDGSRKRYLPKKAWEQMSEKEKEETDRKKLDASEQGHQYVGNTGKAKDARKQAEKDSGKAEEASTRQTRSAGKGKTSEPQSAPKSPASRPQSRNGKQQTQSQQNGKKSMEDRDEEGQAEKTEESKTSQKENQSPSQGQKRGRKTKDDGGDAPDTNKKQKTDDDKTVGSKHDAATPPAKQGSTSRLPKKGQKNVHWKAMPGWVEGEVVEVVKEEKEVEGKKVKASKQKPQVVLKSKSSGKICVHKADNVYFD